MTARKKSVLAWVTIALGTVPLLVGCSAGPHTRVISGVFGDGGRLDDRPYMKETHLLATVPWDEKGINEVNGMTNTSFYATGIRRGTQLVQYRAVALWTSSMEGSGFLWIKDGKQAYVTAALVPDHITMLKAGDVVEWRSISSWDSLNDWESTGEGQVVTRVICRKADPNYKACFDAQPVYNKVFKATGRTGTPYPVSVKEYGFTFSRFYDMNGKLIRPIPSISTANQDGAHR